MSMSSLQIKLLIISYRVCATKSEPKRALEEVCIDCSTESVLLFMSSKGVIVLFIMSSKRVFVSFNLFSKRMYVIIVSLLWFVYVC